MAGRKAARMTGVPSSFIISGLAVCPGVLCVMQRSDGVGCWAVGHLELLTLEEFYSRLNHDCLSFNI